MCVCVCLLFCWALQGLGLPRQRRANLRCLNWAAELLPLCHFDVKNRHLVHRCKYIKQAIRACVSEKDRHAPFCVESELMLGWRSNVLTSSSGVQCNTGTFHNRVWSQPCHSMSKAESPSCCCCFHSSYIFCMKSFVPARIKVHLSQMDVQDRNGMKLFRCIFCPSNV